MIKHIFGITKDGQKFTYCPIGHIVSWNQQDHTNSYCSYCNIFTDMVQ